MTKSDSPYIAQMLECIANIRQYVGTLTYEEFLDDSKTQDAVLMQLQQMGETAKRVSDVAKDKVDIPWQKIAGFRNVVVHEYYDILLSLVWNDVISKLGDVEVPLATYLKEHPLLKEEV